MNWTFGRRLAAGFALAGAALLVIAVFGYTSIHKLIENDRWVTHTDQVRLELRGLLSAAEDEETGQRGFLITGDDAFLEPYRNGKAGAQRSIDELRRLTSDNPAQQRRLDLARSLLDQRLLEIDKGISLRRASGATATVDFVAHGEGKKTMDDLRRVIDDMDHEERDLLETRHTEAEDSAQSAKAVISWGSAAGLLFVAIVGVFISRAVTQQVGSAVRHVQGSSSELQAAANQQAAGAREQATAMNEITTTINELLVTSRQIAESAQRVTEVSERTATASRAGGQTVERGQEAIASIQRQVDALVKHMLELGRKSQQIGSVLDIVSELAEQTNILAINATIEAAGAGESGRRFAVVADEIRKLADRVGGSTKEIRGLIDDVRSAVNTSVMTTETGAKAVEAGSKQFSEVAVSFKQITGLVTTTTDAAKEIGLSTKQQASAVEQVNSAILDVAQAAKETEVSTEQTLKTASELAGLSQDLLRIIEPQAATAPRRRLSA